MRRYVDEPHARPARDARDGLATVADGTAQRVESGDPSPDIPIDSWPYMRPQRSALAPRVLDPRGSMETPQASGGRRLLDPALALPVQSPTPDPNRQIIPRPLPAPYDASQVLDVRG